MTTFFRTSTVVVVAIMALGCGGIWDQALISASLDQAAEWRGKLMNVAPGPDRDAASIVIDDYSAYAATHPIGIVDLASMGVAFDDMVKDGVCDSAEVTRFRGAFQSVASKQPGP